MPYPEYSIDNSQIRITKVYFDFVILFTLISACVKNKIDSILWLKPMLIQCNFKWIWSSAFNCLKSIQVQWLFGVNRTIAHYLLCYLYNLYLILYTVCSSNIGIMDQVKVFHLFCTKPVSELIMIYCQSNLRNELKCGLKWLDNHCRNVFKCIQQNGSHWFQASM